MGITYSNGAAPDSALRFIDGTHVTPDIYARVTLLQQAAALQGLEVHVIRLGGYANFAEQRARQTNNNKASTIPVANVGSSTHGIYSPGRVDLGNTLTTYTDAWLAKILPLAAACGLVREFGNNDPNHFEATGQIAWKPPAHPEPQTAAVVPEEDTDMKTVFHRGDGIDWNVGPALLDINRDNATASIMLYVQYDGHIERAPQPTDAASGRLNDPGHTHGLALETNDFMRILQGHGIPLEAVPKIKANPDLCYINGQYINKGPFDATRLG